MRAWRCGHGGTREDWRGTGLYSMTLGLFGLLDLFVLFYCASLLNACNSQPSSNVLKWAILPTRPATRTTSGSIYLHSILLYEIMSYVRPIFSQSKEGRAEQLGNEAAATMVSVMQKESCSKKLRSGCVWHPRLRHRLEPAVWTRQNVMSERNAGQGYWWGVWMLRANLARFCLCAASDCCLRTSLICSSKSQTQVSPVVSSPSDPMLLSSATERKQTR